MPASPNFNCLVYSLEFYICQILRELTKFASLNQAPALDLGAGNMTTISNGCLSFAFSFEDIEVTCLNCVTNGTCLLKQ